MRLPVAAALAFVPFMTMSEIAQAQMAQPMPLLNVSATAEVQVAPDMAIVSAGVMTQDATAQKAMQDNARQMSAVMEALRKAGVDARDIQTSGLSLNPQYRYAENQPPVITGYQASNTVTIRMRKIDGVGPVLDTLVARGANQISGPAFVVSNEEGALDQARKDAVARARARADLYAAAANVRIKRVMSITEGGGMAQPVPMVRAMAMKAEMADTPVAPGQVSLSVTVTMSFEIEGK